MIFFVLLICFFMMCCIILAFKYRNPYKLIMVFGKKGAGKTTFLAKTAYRALKQGHPVYSTVPIPGVQLFDVQDVGRMMFPPESVILIDEVGMIWDNRSFKSFRTDVRDYFKLQRHYRHTVYLFSQTFDVDVKLRNLTDAMYLLRCHMGWLSVARRIRRDIVIVEPSGESESRIADSLEFEPVWLSFFGARTVIFTFIPSWVRLFSSFDAPELFPNRSDFCALPAVLPRRFRRVLHRAELASHACPAAAQGEEADAPEV